MISPKKQNIKSEIQEDQQPLIPPTKMDKDPFYQVRDECQNQVEKLKVRHLKFLDIVRNTNTASNPEFKDVNKSLGKDLREIDKSMKALAVAVDTVDKNRSKFPQIKDGELASRKRIVSEMQNSIQEIKNSRDSPQVRSKLEEDQSRSNRASYDDEVKSHGGVERENSRFIKDQKLATKDAIKRQDENLVVLGKAVDRLEDIGKGINEELRVQDKMLDGLEGDIDDATDRMNTVQAALSKLLKTKDGCQIWTIVILAVILILLVALVIWT